MTICKRKSPLLSCQHTGHRVFALFDHCDIINIAVVLAERGRAGAKGKGVGGVVAVNIGPLSASPPPPSIPPCIPQVVNWQALVDMGTISQQDVDDILFTDCVDEAFNHITTRLAPNKLDDLNGHPSPSRCRPCPSNPPPPLGLPMWHFWYRGGGGVSITQPCTVPRVRMQSLNATHTAEGSHFK